MARKKMTSQENLSRRLVIVTGDKGGVGKSTFARGLLQAWIDAKQDFVAFDADISNPQIKRFYEKECTIEPLNIFKRGQTDIFLQGLGNISFTLINRLKMVNLVKLCFPKNHYFCWNYHHNLATF